MCILKPSKIKNTIKRLCSICSCSASTTIAIWDSTSRNLFLSAEHSLWDLKLADETSTLFTLSEGSYRWHIDAAPVKYRPAGTLVWRKFSVTKFSSSSDLTDIHELQSVTETSYVGLTTPDTRYLEEEPLTIQFLPSNALIYEVKLGGTLSKHVILDSNVWEIKEGLPTGKYTVKVRCVKGLATDFYSTWTDWSNTLKFTVYSLDEQEAVEKLRIFDHQLAMIIDKDFNNIVTVTDPSAKPPNYRDDRYAKWFQTPCYEGSTKLLNEETAYYCDPLTYYIECLQILVDKGVIFRTWHDLLDGQFGHSPFEVILQFDVDAGRQSLKRVAEAIKPFGIRANVMIHREAYDWYEYKVEDLDLEYLRVLEEQGWVVGYHNNSIGNTQRLNRVGNYGEQVLDEAKARFVTDVEYLRKWFRIRTFTHHGGNVYNRYLPLPDKSLNIVCVDKRYNQSLWAHISSSFSDGGFIARPDTLKGYIKSLSSGLHFMRNHPLKYGNYEPPFDVDPSTISEAMRVGQEVTPQLETKILQEKEKETLWLNIRDKHRVLTKRLTYASPQKPISKGLRSHEEIDEKIEMLRKHRRDTFLRMYPWKYGDPRVFWWRILHAYAPTQGEILNVGALYPSQRNETAEFLSKDTTILEMDIDPERKPHFLCDIVDAPSDLNERFSGVLLMGLPYFSSPSLAINACHSLTSPGGIGIFGFCADTHPARGGRWHPERYPVWRHDKEPLSNPSLRTQLWSFSEAELNNLFTTWNHFQYEFFYHYWFVVCQKSIA